MSRKSEFDRLMTEVVEMTVKKTASPKQPNPLYTIETVEIKKLALDAPHGGIERVTDERNTPQASFNNNIRALLSSVKAVTFLCGIISSQ